MPVYETLQSDKNSIVFEFGSAYTKCGFTSEPSPRAIIPSQIYLESVDKVISIFQIKNHELFAAALEKFIQMIYFKYLAANPKDRRVIIVESVFCQLQIRQQIAQIFFKRFDVPSILFVPNHIVVLATLGINTAIVFDIGYLEAIATPIYEGITILDSIQYAPLGGRSIQLRLMDELIQRKTLFIKNGTEQIINNESILNENLDESTLEDIIYRTCFVTTIERGSQLARQKLIDQQHQQDVEHQQSTDSEEPKQQIKQPPKSIKYSFGGNKFLLIPGSLRESVCEVLFEMYGCEHTLATLIIDTIIGCPLDCRRRLAQNIVIIGGCSMLTGLKHRLFKEIKYLTKHSERYQQYRSSLMTISDEFKFHQLPCKENYANWLGASIWSTIDLLSMRSITQEQYKKNNYQLINDWCNYDDHHQLLPQSLSQQSIRTP